MSKRSTCHEMQELISKSQSNPLAMFAALQVGIHLYSETGETKLWRAIPCLAGSCQVTETSTTTIPWKYRICFRAGGHLQVDVAELAHWWCERILVRGWRSFCLGFVACSLEATEPRRLAFSEWETSMFVRFFAMNAQLWCNDLHTLPRELFGSCSKIGRSSSN